MTPSPWTSPSRVKLSGSYTWFTSSWLHSGSELLVGILTLVLCNSKWIGCNCHVPPSQLTTATVEGPQLEPLPPWPPPDFPGLRTNYYRMNSLNAHHSACASLIPGWGTDTGSYILTLFCPAHAGYVVLALFKHWFTIEDCICKPNCTPFDVA